VAAIEQRLTVALKVAEDQRRTRDATR